MTIFRELTRTKGTGDVALAGRAPGAVTWAGSGKNGQNVRYSITENGNVEIGTGLYSGNILRRSAVQETLYNGVHTTSGATPIPLDGGAVVDLLVTNEVTIRKSAFGQVFDVETEDPAEVVVKARTSPGGGVAIQVGDTGLTLPATLRQQPNQPWPAARPAYDGPITLLGWDAPPSWGGGEYDQYIAIPRVHVPITETFGAYAPGAVPDWTPTWGDSVAREISVVSDPLSTDGRVLRVYQSPGTTTYTVWDRSRVETDQSILARVLAPAVQTKTGNGVTLMLRSSVAHMSADRHGYGLAIRCESTRRLRMVKWNAGTISTLAETALPESVKSASAVVWMEFTVVGTSLTGKLWFDGEDRSDAITVTATDATIAQGRQGIGSFLNNYANLIDYVAVSYSGQPAQGPGA